MAPREPAVVQPVAGEAVLPIVSHSIPKSLEHIDGLRSRVEDLEASVDDLITISLDDDSPVLTVLSPLEALTQALSVEVAERVGLEASIDRLTSKIEQLLLRESSSSYDLRTRERLVQLMRELSNRLALPRISFSAQSKRKQVEAETDWGFAGVDHWGIQLNNADGTVFGSC